MQTGKDTSRGAIGGSSTLGAQQQGNITHGVMPEQVVKNLQQALQDNPGSEFLIVQQVRQSEEPRIWSTGDPEQTKSLFRSAYDTLGYEREPAVS